MRDKTATAQRIYRIPIPTGKTIVCRKVLLALTEWRARSSGIQHFDEESGRATWDDLHVIEASDESRIEVLLRDEKSGDTFWVPAHYDASGEYALTLRKPDQVSVVIRTSESISSDPEESDEHWTPTELQTERPQRTIPAPAIGRARPSKRAEKASLVNTLWG